jgi:hypothetical protein
MEAKAAAELAQEKQQQLQVTPGKPGTDAAFPRPSGVKIPGLNVGGLLDLSA